MLFAKRLFYASLFLLPALFNSAYAQEKDSEISANTHPADQIIISATRNEISSFDATQSVSVISKSDIETSAFDRVEDIVRSTAGLYNFRHSALQTNGIVSPLSMRGVGKNRVLLLVDGVPQNDNFNNSIAWIGWGHIPKETIERIEIVRGPGSTLYGSEGLGGVINIITKKPSAERKTSVRGEAGNASTYGGYGFHSQKFSDFGFMIAGGYEDSDGFHMSENPKDYEIKRYRELAQGLFKATYDFTPSTDISFGSLLYNQDAGQGREYFHNDLRLDQYWLNLSSRGAIADLKGLLYLNRAEKTAYQDNAADNYTSLNRKEKFRDTYTWGGDIQGTVVSLNFAKITFGGSYKEAVMNYDEDYTGSARDAGAEGKQNFISPFSTIDFNLFNNSLMINLGIRYDRIKTSDGANWDTQASGGKPAYDNEFDDTTNESVSPKIGIAWHPDNKTTIRTSGGKGFRAPSLFELYKVHVRGGGTYYREANPELKPEKIWSYDFGIERYILDSLWAKVSFYQSFAEDYIGDRLTGTGTFASGTKTRYEYKLDNINGVDIYGIETEVQWTCFDGVTLFANYTYNISKVAKDDNNDALEGNYLPNDPRHNAHGGIKFLNPKIFDLSVIANYYADIFYDNENTLKTEDYWTVDMSISRKFMDHINVYVKAENIFDKEYPIFLSSTGDDTIAPGLIIKTGAGIEF